MMEHSVRSHTPRPMMKGDDLLLVSSRRRVTLYTMSIYIVTSHGEMLRLSNDTNDSTTHHHHQSLVSIRDSDFDTTTATGTLTIPALPQLILTSSSSVSNHTHGGIINPKRSRRAVFLDIDDWMITSEKGDNNSSSSHVVTPSILSPSSSLSSNHNFHTDHKTTTTSMELILQQQLPTLRGTFVRKYIERNFS